MALTNSSDLADQVRKWIHYDQLAGTLAKQATQARKARDTSEKSIINILRTNNMANAILQTAGGRLTLHEEKHAQPLSLQRLELLLHTYYAEKRRGAPDETEAIMSYIRANRGFTQETRLKRN
jgi:hypothetical protein